MITSPYPYPYPYIKYFLPPRIQPLLSLIGQFPQPCLIRGLSKKKEQRGPAIANQNLAPLKKEERRSKRGDMASNRKKKKKQKIKGSGDGRGRKEHRRRENSRIILADTFLNTYCCLPLCIGVDWGDVIIANSSGWGQADGRKFRIDYGWREK